MAELGESGNPRDLIPGDPAGIEENVVAIRGRGKSMAAAGDGLTKIDAHSWRGTAGNEFRDKFSYEPSRWRQGGDSFDKAAAALEGYAGTLRWAQGQADEAIRQWDAAQAVTARARTDHLAAVDHVNQQNKYNAVYGDRTQLPAPQFSDTGEAGRQAAREIVNRARQQLTEAADRASQTIWAEGDSAPETGFWEDVGGFFADVGQGIADPFVSGGKLLLSMTGISAFWDDNFDEPMVTTAQNAKFLATHPVEFAKALTDWNTWSDSPGRAIGHLLGGVAMTGVAGKVVGELAHIPGKAEARSPLGAGVKTIDAKPLSIEQKQVEKKYNSHATDFGVNDPRGKDGFTKFEQAIQDVTKGSQTLHIDGMYRGDPAIINYNPSSNLVVVQKPSGEFVSGWKLGDKQAQYVLETGKLS